MIKRPYTPDGLTDRDEPAYYRPPLLRIPARIVPATEAGGPRQETVDERRLLEMLLGILNQVQLFGWCTMYHAKQVVMQELHGELRVLVDRFMRGYLARFKKQPVNAHDLSFGGTTDASAERMISFLRDERQKILNLRNASEKQLGPGLLRVLDDIYGAMERAAYGLNLL